MKLSDFDYVLPENLIAQEPLKDRSASRLLVLDKNTGEVAHKVFKDILAYVNPGDCLVFNDTRVIPARLFGMRVDTKATIELLLLKRRDINSWETLVKPGKKARIGAEIIFGNGELKGKIEAVLESGNRVIRFEYNGVFEEILEKLGHMPLPPYITKKLEDKERYQTVYSKNNGSAAAPTAGLHFTNELMDKLKSKGVQIAFVTLHVGLGTFRPVKTENVLEHEMHSEYFNIQKEEADKINNAKKNGGRIISVGTTSTRTLESSCDELGNVIARDGWTDIFIYPGYKFKVIDSIITNFHLPKSTLLMLVSALAGKENVLHAYKVAVESEYRFFSFGDAMMIV
ncbi:MAG: tRNA preQ1(34) S-adenosylmethionine ribosyltransferase-isomerase QueA [Clostridiales bacterium GWE2_32_10]|nr:MAG: tRNA preQ1(34) S-adenosylmethionine ribosyltransferase-isomerase QueA [Clostridiales bacterium GWE2_32_10]HBY20456.1 tRNA preQ1(34) S-adenosylmethionine ribosyltransferase-isomerase QueA [Clostridiales bacterium]